MGAEYSPRHALPFLATAQAQKEITHNEAIALIDALLHPSIEAVAGEPPLLVEADRGKCWLVAAGAVDAWAGHDDDLACWTGGSWRFLTMPMGARIFDSSGQFERRLTESGWLAAPEIALAPGGSVIDFEAREVIELLLEHLRATGVVVGGA